MKFFVADCVSSKVEMFWSRCVLVENNRQTITVQFGVGLLKCFCRITFVAYLLQAPICLATLRKLVDKAVMVVALIRLYCNLTALRTACNRFV